MPLSRHGVVNLWRNSSGNTQPQSCQLAEPVWTDPGLESGFSVHELISFLTKRKVRAENESSNLPPLWKKKRGKKSAGEEWMVEHSPQILAREDNPENNHLLASHCKGAIWRRKMKLFWSCFVLFFSLFFPPPNFCSVFFIFLKFDYLINTLDAFVNTNR